MKYKLALIVVALLVAMFLIGRFTAKKEVVVDTRKIDSLKRDIRERTWRFSARGDSLKEALILADTWYRMANGENQKERIIIRTIYAQDTTRNRSLTQLERDNLIRTIFH